MAKRELAKLYSLLVFGIIISISVVSINVYANEYINERLGINLNFSQGLTLSDVSTDEKDCKKDNSCLLVFNSQENPKIQFTILIQHGKQFENNCECESLLEFAQYEYKKYGSLEGFTLIDDNQTTLNDNIPSIQMEYELARSTGDSRHLVVWTTINDIFYTISYHHIKKHDTIPDDYSSRLPIFKQVLKSITFFEPTENIQSIQAQQDKKKPSFMIPDDEDDEDKQDKDDSVNVATSIEGNSTETTNDENIVAKIILTKIKYKSDRFSDHLLSQITNVGNETAQKVRVLLTYYDKENFLINRGYVSPELDTLDPGQKSGFNIMIDEKTGDDMEAYKVSFKWSHPDGSKGYAENVELEDEANYFVEPSPGKLTEEEIEKLGLFER